MIHFDPPSVRSTLVAALLFATCATPRTIASTTSDATSSDAKSVVAKASGATSPGLAAVLDSINADNIKTDLYFVASDEQEGRDTPSEGQRRVARYIAARLERLGWQPAAPKGYLYTYPLEQRKLDEDKCTLEWQAEGKRGVFHLGKDYFLPTNRDVRASNVHGKIVFVGAGSKAEFENKALEGKIALCFDTGEDIRDVGRRAREAKCIGIVLAPGPDYAGEPYTERFAVTLQRQRDGGVRWPEKPKETKPAPEKESSAEKREAFASILMTREAVVALLTAAKEPETPKTGAQVSDLEETRVVLNGGRIDCENVCGLWPGSDPVLGQETILVTAHYDHVGVINGEIYNGADDNGSGTCGLMAIAEALTKAGPMRRSVMLMWVSGEEKGLWGSKAWTENPFLPGDHKAICDINIDMIGRNAPEKLLITPTKDRPKDYNGLTRLAEKLSPLEGFPTLGSADEYYTRSDHYNFAKMGLPVTFLFDDVHEDYHRPTDDVDKIDYDKIRRVVRLVVRMLDGLQTDKLDLK